MRVGAESCPRTGGPWQAESGPSRPATQKNRRPMRSRAPTTDGRQRQTGRRLVVAYDDTGNNVAVVVNESHNVVETVVRSELGVGNEHR